MSTRRFVSRALVAAAGALSLAACADSTAPAAPAPSRAAALAPRPSFEIRGTKVAIRMRGDTATAQFTVRPKAQQTFVFGGKHAVKFAAQAICDPSVSTYGPTEWDKPCVPASGPVTITVKAYKNALGRVSTEFQPALRFNPASQGVFLYLEDQNSNISPWFKQIDFCTDAGVCVDESLTDPSLRTFYNPSKDLYGRRIKHFSGYVIGVGRAEELL